MADVNKVLLYGLIPMIPACLIGGVWLSRFYKKIEVIPPTELFQERHFEKGELPGLGVSVLCAVTPIILMLIGAVIDLSFGPPPAKTELTKLGIENITGFYHHLFAGKGFSEQVNSLITYFLTILKFLSDANIALFVAVIVAILTLGLRNGKTMDDVMNSSSKSIGAISMIMLIIASGGAF